MFALASTLVVAAAACTSGGGGTDAARPAAERTVSVDGPPRKLAGVDLSRHSVPLADIHFDTFTGGSIPLSRITARRLRLLRDAIPPLDDPKYDRPADARYLKGKDAVLGYESASGEAFAYPFKILNFHEIVNDEIGGIPVVITYCPLCRSGAVYDRRVDGRVLAFGNTSALYQSDLVMYDRDTNSYWWQVAGEAIVGELTGAKLRLLPSIGTTWKQWRRLHPDTKVLSIDTGFDRPYQRDSFRGYAASVNAGSFPFPVSEEALDSRLRPADDVVGVTLNGESKAYPLRNIKDGVVEDTVGGRRVVVFSSAEGPSGAVYSPIVAGRRLTFRFQRGDYVDLQTRTTWDLGGKARTGPLRGSALKPIPSKSTFWFEWVVAYPETSVWRPGG